LTECQQQAVAHTNTLLQQAGSHFGASIPPIDICFDLTGQAAGMVRYSRGGGVKISYNRILLQENRDDFIIRTVPHEVAHVVARAAFGNCKPHGEEWRQVMDYFGVESSRCHPYDTSRSSTRRLRRYDYVCGCRQHKLTSIRHNRISRGQAYLCRQCGDRLQLAKDAKSGT
jgi:SprT protein